MELKTACLAVFPNNYMPIFSVIMNCLNGEKFLRQAINSVYDQSFTDWEIIFFDSGSTDRSVEIASEYGERVKIFKLGQPVPLGQARQEAVDKATGDFLVFLDVDDVWLSFKLQLQYDLMKSGEYDVCYGGVQCIDGFNKLSYKILPKHKSGVLFEQFLTHVEGLWCTFVINRKKLMHKGTKFNPVLRCSSEEDMVLSFLAYEGKGIVIHDVIAYYRIISVPTSVTSSNKNRWALERNATLERLTNENPDVKTKFQKAFKSAEARGFYYKSSYLMDQGYYKEALEAMREAAKIDKKFRVLQVLVAWPSMWNFIHQYKGYLAPLWLKLR